MVFQLQHEHLTGTQDLHRHNNRGHKFRDRLNNPLHGYTGDQISQVQI